MRCVPSSGYHVFVSRVSKPGWLPVLSPINE